MLRRGIFMEPSQIVDLCIILHHVLNILDFHDCRLFVWPKVGPNIQKKSDLSEFWKMWPSIGPQNSEKI